LNRNLLSRVIRNEGIDAQTVEDPEEADLILALDSRMDDKRLQKTFQDTGATLYPVRKNSSSHMRRMLREVFATIEGISEEDVREAVSETEFAIQRVITENIEVSLAPRSHSLRRMQHRIAARYHLATRSVGQEPTRHLIISPH
jgi:hypothetical protein